MCARIIAYFDDEVDKSTEVVVREFEIVASLALRDRSN
jgi:hypothetical protein